MVPGVQWLRLMSPFFAAVNEGNSRNGRLVGERGSLLEALGCSSRQQLATLPTGSSASERCFQQRDELFDSRRQDIMNIKHFRSIVVSVWLGCLPHSLALAQPVIATQPTNQFVSASVTASFSVLATGVAPITYQWLFDGAAMAGGTNRVFSLLNAQPAQSGYYSVILSNASGFVTSQVAELKVFLSLPTTHSLSGIQAVSNGSVSLSLKGETTLPFAPYYALYPVETSSNLVDWAPLVTLQRTNTALDVLSFSDTNAPLFNRRFYRTPTNQLATPLPQPTGPYPVGTFSMLLTNTYRTNAKFMVSFWYPAVAQAGVLPAAYVEKPIIR